MAEIFGLDFGTTNTLAAVRFGGEAEVAFFLARGRPHPSVVQYRGSQVIAGRQARDQLDSAQVGVIGNFVRSPKRYLGKTDEVYVGGVARDPAEVVADILRHVKRHAEDELAGRESFSNIVATIPITMDGRGRREYRRAARLAGIEIHQFVHEPLAAVYGYLRRRPDFRRYVAELEGRLVLVFDWGGGTLDLTLCRVSAGSVIQLHNLGDQEVGGDRFDERVMRLVEDRHVARYGLTQAPVLIPGAHAQLNAECENAKIRLSRAATAQVLVAQFAKDEGPARTLEERISVQDLRDCVSDLIDRGLSAIDDLLGHVGIRSDAIALCLATGGMMQVPEIRARLLERFAGPGRVPLLDHGDRIIAEGAAWIASDGQPLTLAKPFEVLHANNAYVALFDAEMALPTMGKAKATSLAMYCVDPRDSFARFLFARPSAPDRQSAGDRRDPYAVALVAVDPTARPFLERLNLQVTIDHDLTARVNIRSTMGKDERELEIHDLEFGLRLGSK